MRLIVTNTFVPFERDGDDASDLANGLTDAIRKAGHRVDLVRFPIDPDAAHLPSQFAAMRLIDMTLRCTEGIDRLITVGALAHAFAHPRKIPWFFQNGPQKARTGSTHQGEDLAALEGVTLRESCGLYAATNGDALKLQRQYRIGATGLFYPPPLCERAAESAPRGDSFILAGPDLKFEHAEMAVRAIARLKDGEGKLIIASRWVEDCEGNDLRNLIGELGCDGKVTLVPYETSTLGNLLDSSLAAIELGPADGLCGRITLEAFTRRRAVVTVSDAGWPTELVKDKQTGIVTEPTSFALSIALKSLLQNREEAAKLGEAGFQMLQLQQIGWNHIVERLAA